MTYFSKMGEHVNGTQKFIVNDQLKQTVSNCMDWLQQRMTVIAYIVYLK